MVWNATWRPSMTRTRCAGGCLWRRPNNESDVCDKSSLFTNCLAGRTHRVDQPVAYSSRRGVSAVGRPQQLRLPAASRLSACLASSLHHPRTVCGEGRVRKTFYLSAPGRAGRLRRPVTVAPAGPINHGCLSASSCDAAALRTATPLFVY